MNKQRERILSILLGTLLSGMIGPITADDTDIYTAPVTVRLPGDVRPWPMLLLSYSITSDSMNRSDIGNVKVIVENNKVVPVRDGTSDDLQFMIPGSGVLPDGTVEEYLPDAAADAYLNAKSIDIWPSVVDVTNAGGSKTLGLHGNNLYAAVLFYVHDRLEVGGLVPNIRLGMRVPHPSPTGAGIKGEGAGFFPLDFGPSQADVNRLAGSGVGPVNCADYSLGFNDTNYATVNDVSGACAKAAQLLRKAQFYGYKNRVGWLQRIAYETGAGYKFDLGGMDFELYRYLKGLAPVKGAQSDNDFGLSNDYQLRCDDNTPGCVVSNDEIFIDGAYSTIFRRSAWYHPSLVDTKPSLAAMTDPDMGSQGHLNPIAWDDMAFTSGNFNTYDSPLTYTDKDGEEQLDLICSGINVINFMSNPANLADSAENEVKTDALDEMPNAECPDSIPGGNCKLFIKTLNSLYLEDFIEPDGNTETPETRGTQNVRSFFVTKQISQAVTKAAIAGGGLGQLPFKWEKPRELARAIESLFRLILSESSTFVAPSVPPSAINQTRSVHEVFLALFSAEDGRVWPGNLKKLRIERSGANRDGPWIIAAMPADGDISNGFPNALADGGRIAHNLVTYWTNATELDDTAGSWDPTEATEDTDGRMIERGGAGQQFNLQSSRTLYTQGPGLNGLKTVTNANGAGLSPAAYNWLQGRDWKFGDSLHSRPVAINYGARTTGYSDANPDIRLVLGSNDGLLRMVTNTRPYFASEDFNTIMEAQRLNDLTIQSGEETWAFLPQELTRKVEWLATGIDLVTGTEAPDRHPNLFDGAPAVYRVDANDDGKITDPEGDYGATGDQVFVFVGLRRGGKSYYAFDLTRPGDPILMWDIHKTDSDFTEFGQTWSTPQVGVMRILESKLDTSARTNCTEDADGITRCDRIVLALGGGYNGDDDGLTGTPAFCDGSDLGFVNPDSSTPAVVQRRDALFALGDDIPNRDCGVDMFGTGNGGNSVYYDDDEGNAIFVIDALTGTLIWKKTGLDDSVPADVVAVDMDGDDYLDRIYFGDTGGVLWRVNLTDSSCNDESASSNCKDQAGWPDDANPENWRAYPLLSVGRHVSGAAYDRRFLVQPDVVSTYDNTGNFDGVLVGTGDREDPLHNTVQDSFYFYKDALTGIREVPILRTTNSSGDLPAGRDKLAQVRVGAQDNSFLDLDTSTWLPNGWFTDMAVYDESADEDGIGGDIGEKVVGKAITLGGVVYFSTYMNAELLSDGERNPCIPSAGSGRIYALNILDEKAGEPVSFHDADGTTLAYIEVDSPGIPPNVVPVGLDDGVRLILPGVAKGTIHDPDVETFFPTFWRREDN